MKVSKSFLNEYIKVDDINYNELAEKMVFAGNEYESIEPISNAKNLVVGEILECCKHPDSAKLSICKVDIGESEPVQILCGAPNVVDAKKVIVAKIGAVLSGIEIKKAKLAGMESNGMICSLAELGLDSKYVTEADKDGIHKLGDDAITGTDAIKYLGYDDETIDFELTANRADLLSLIGMAYEVGAIYKREVKEPVIKLNETSENVEDIISLDVQTENCSIYLGKLVRNVVIKESPYFIKARLMASGIRPINNVVDISNYVMLEYGQPLHFFDYDQLGNKVVVRQALENEQITTLDGQKRNLKNNDIVIANDKEAVCLAGVMGGLNTEVEMTTKNIFVEAAIFEPKYIRYTSKAILRSEASSRYEKGIDPNRTDKAIKRACELLEEYASGEVTRGMLIHDVANHNDKVIDITLNKINSVLGFELKTEDVIDVFERLGFTTTVNKSTLTVIVPTRRLDVNIKEDLIEEVGRIYGYEHVIGTMPSSSVKKGGYQKPNLELKEVRNRLQALGLNQVITYSLVSENEHNQFVQNELESVTLDSAMSEDRKYMRQSLIPSLLNVYKYNSARGMKDVRAFEAASIYYKKENKYIENRTVTGLLSGTYLSSDWQGIRLNVDFYTVKGILENLLTYLGLKGRYQFIQCDNLKDMHPGRSASIVVDRQTVGIVGQVHPKFSKKEVYAFEIDFNKLMEIKVRGIKFKEMNKYPTVKKDVAFIVRKDITSGQIKEVIYKAGGRLLTNIQVFDVYVGDNVESDEKSIAYSLEFQDITHTLTDEEITNVFNNIITNVTTKLGAKLRDK